MMMVSINDSLDASTASDIHQMLIQLNSGRLRLAPTLRGVREKIRGRSNNEWKTLIIGCFVVRM
jgi:hypothetical protein